MDYDPEKDLRELEAMASNLIPYLYEDELFGMIAANLPRLTVGGLLLRLKRLETLEEILSEEQEQRMRDARLNFEHLRSDWRVHYERKVTREFKSRVNNLMAFLGEYDEDKSKGRNNYPIEAIRRTIIALLKEEAINLELWTEDMDTRLTGADKQLKNILDTNKSEFVLANGLQSVYPGDKYWWLYTYPKGE